MAGADDARTRLISSPAANTVASDSAKGYTGSQLQRATFASAVGRIRWGRLMKFPSYGAGCHVLSPDWAAPLATMGRSVHTSSAPVKGGFRTFQPFKIRDVASRNLGVQVRLCTSGPCGLPYRRLGVVP